MKTVEGKNLSQRKGCTTLVVGGSGTGKSTLAATMPGKKWIADFDHNIAPYVGIPNLTLTEFQLGELKQFEVKFNEALLNPEIDSIIIDSLSSYEMSYVHALSGGTMVGMSLNKWAVMFAGIKNLLLEGRSWNKLVLITAHEEPVKDEDLGIIRYRPYSYGKKLPDELPRFLDNVFRLEIFRSAQGAEFMCHTTGEQRWMAKNIWHILGPVRLGVLTRDRIKIEGWKAIEEEAARRRPNSETKGGENK